MKGILPKELLPHYNIIDIRESYKYNEGHIYNSLNIPFDKLLLNHSKYLKKDEVYYIYCQKGIQSRNICSILNNYGYNTINIIGGYNSWLKSE